MDTTTTDIFYKLGKRDAAEDTAVYLAGATDRLRRHAIEHLEGSKVGPLSERDRLLIDFAVQLTVSQISELRP